MGTLQISVDMPELAALLADVLAKQDQTLTYLRTIMTTDAAIQAIAADLGQDWATIHDALASIAATNQAILDQLKTQVVAPETLAALSTQQAQLDALAAAAQQQAADEAAAIPPTA